MLIMGATCGFDRVDIVNIECYVNDPRRQCSVILVRTKYYMIAILYLTEKNKLRILLRSRHIFIELFNVWGY